MKTGSKLYLGRKARKLLPTRKGDGLTNHERVLLNRKPEASDV